MTYSVNHAIVSTVDSNNQTNQDRPPSRKGKYIMKKSISVSNLTLDLYLHHVRPAAIKAGLLEDAITEDGKPYHITEEAVAKEIESAMRCACFNAERVADEAEQMLYQLGVSIKYCNDSKVVEALQALRDAMIEVAVDKEIEEAAQRDTGNENFDHCKRIGMEIEKVISGGFYRCPECGEIVEWNNDNYNDDDCTYLCSECGKTVDESDLEPVDLLDYFSDVLDIEYRIGSDKQYRSVRLMVAYGGPNIYIDTASGSVELYWWTERASFRLNDDAVEAIDRTFEELFNL